jgi:hypothetical protein
MTRQKAGTPRKRAAFDRPGPGVAGGVKAPAATLCADVMVTLGKLSLERLSHVDPPVGAAAREAAARISSAIIENFVMDLLLRSVLWRLYTGNCAGADMVF